MALTSSRLPAEEATDWTTTRLSELVLIQFQSFTHGAHAVTASSIRPIKQCPPPPSPRRRQAKDMALDSYHALH